LTHDSYEMVLGVHWLESLGPILWDFSRRILAFMRNGHWVTWTRPDATTPSPVPLFSATSDIMEALLDEFEPLFACPAVYRRRAHTHRIQLLPGTSPFMVCPY
jgi:hypothetical protein